MKKLKTLRIKECFFNSYYNSKNSWNKIKNENSLNVNFSKLGSVHFILSIVKEQDYQE